MASNGDSNDPSASSSEQQSLAKPKASQSSRTNSDQLCGTNSSCYSRTYDAHTTDDSDNESGSHHDTKSSKRSLLKSRNKYSSHIRSHNHHHPHHHKDAPGPAYLANQMLNNSSPSREFVDDTVSRKSGKAEGRKYDDSKSDDYELSDERVSARVLASRRQSSPTSFSPSVNSHTRQGILKQTSRESSTSNLESASAFSAMETDSGFEAQEEVKPAEDEASSDKNANRYSRANSEMDSRAACKQPKPRLISNTLEFHQVSAPTPDSPA